LYAHKKATSQETGGDSINCYIILPKESGITYVKLPLLANSRETFDYE